MFKTFARQRLILTTNDRERWRSLVGALPQRDVFFTPEYVTLFERLSGEAARLFVYGDDANYVIYPFFVRRINDLAFYRALPLDGHTQYFDVVSPYGYSGPAARVVDPDAELGLWRGYLSAFHQYCLDARIVCEFARLNPFVGNHRYLQILTGGVQVSNDIIYADLTRSEEELWHALNRGNRSNIHKARRAGVRVERSDERAHVARFYELYVATMRRNQAVGWYYFSPEFFEDSFAWLGDKISLFCASCQNQIIAAASFLHDGDIVHYFLGGSDREHLDLRPNNLLMYQVMCWAKRQGYRLFNLGGRYGSNENLARFKAAFSKRTIPFYTYRAVHNVPVYHKLCQRHAEYRSSTGRPPLEDASYFPLYRANGLV